MGSFFQTLSVLETLFWISLAIVAIVALYYLYKWLKSLYTDFTEPNSTIEDTITNLFTKHNDDGTVDSKDVAPKGTDPIDWLFMDHDSAEAI